jgi:hypothetical protein
MDNEVAVTTGFPENGRRKGLLPKKKILGKSIRAANAHE